MPLLINNDVAKELLTMKDCVEALEAAFREEAQGSAANRTKSNIHIPTKEPNHWYRYCTMEGGLRESGVAAIRIKSDIVSWPIYHGVQREQKYCVQPGKFCGLILLFSAENGELLAILNDGYVQHMRVGGTAGVAARYMARKEAAVVGVIGSGGMAETHLEAFAVVRKISLAKVYSPNREHRESYARRMADKLGIKVEPKDGPADVVRGSDIVATCTDANDPIIKAEWLDPGAYLTCVRTSEAGEDTFRRADRYVEYRSAVALNHFTTPENQRPLSLGGSDARYMRLVNLVPRERRRHLTDVLAGRAPARESESEVNLFESEGTGVQFAAVAYRVYTLARRKGLGRELPPEWFLQDIRD
jgi:alanine dehydrogenase